MILKQEGYIAEVGYEDGDELMHGSVVNARAVLPGYRRIESRVRRHDRRLPGLAPRAGRRAGEGELGPMKTKYAPFRASDHLDSEEVIAEYLTAAAEDENSDVLLSALAEVAKARGMRPRRGPKTGNVVSFKGGAS